MIVVDASVLLTALLDAGASGALARQVLRDDDQRHAPDLVDIEVVSGIRGRLRGGHLRIDDALTAVADLRDYPLRRHPARLLVEDIFAKRDNLTAYDAAYVCLAERLDATLVTADGRLVRATGVGCAVRLLEP